jgi:hypothetical protein
MRDGEAGINDLVREPFAKNISRRINDFRRSGVAPPLSSLNVFS